MTKQFLKVWGDPRAVVHMDFYSLNWHYVVQTVDNKVCRQLQLIFTIFNDRPIDSIKEAVLHFTHIFFSFFLAFLQTSCGYILIKTFKLRYFYLLLHPETSNHGEITVTTTFISGLDLCIFPCFKYIVYQINSFALIARWFPSTFIILCFFSSGIIAFPTMLALLWGRHLGF